MAALLVAATVFLSILAGSASAQWQIASPDGKSSLKVGFLMQGRAEWLRTPAVGPSAVSTSQNLYLRRLRLILGGKVNDRVTFFLDTDGPNAAKSATTGDKDFPDLYVQDMVATWTVADRLRFDTGLILAPGAYNHLQSAASLLAIDYGPYTFLESSPLKAKVGRDAGVQARGIVGSSHIEYRVGAFQGLRGASSANPFRSTARLTYSPYKLEPGLFYTGTNLGKKPALSFGVAADVQADYRAFHGDVFFDRFVSGHTLTFQADVSHLDGGTLLASLPPQTLWMAEAGVSILKNRVTPYVQAARQDLDKNGDDELTGQYGVAYWIDGHKAALKGAWARSRKDGGRNRNQFTAQYQVFAF
jgi:hypothetical protein